MNRKITKMILQNQFYSIFRDEPNHHEDDYFILEAF